MRGSPSVAWVGEPTSSPAPVATSGRLERQFPRLAGIVRRAAHETAFVNPRRPVRIRLAVDFGPGIHQEPLRVVAGVDGFDEPVASSLASAGRAIPARLARLVTSSPSCGTCPGWMARFRRSPPESTVGRGLDRRGRLRDIDVRTSGQDPTAVLSGPFRVRKPATPGSTDPSGPRRRTRATTTETGTEPTPGFRPPARRTATLAAIPGRSREERAPSA